MSNDLYRNKYRIQSHRLKGWDYSSSGWYFITICTQNREHYFGEVIDNEMHYTELGHVAAASWLAMERVFSILIPDVWVIMPNHVHLLFAISSQNPEFQQSKFKKMIKNSVASIVNHFKGRVTKYANKNEIPFEWQANYYDNIIRDADSFKTVQNYIINNPLNWNTDRFYDK